ncbi:MAG: F0F1 ATP synthase subunit delta [Prevotellaceae bacterium]|nr:F0F1 ATP synthase subunit delta [Prevotellaceae bacterium]
MTRETISRRYAKALFMYAKKHGREKDVFDESQRLEQSFGTYPALKRSLGNVVLHNEKKIKLIEACLGEKASQEFRRFISLVIEKKREELLPLICADYQKLFHLSERLLDVYLTTTKPLGAATEEKLVTKIAQYTQQTVLLHTAVNPDIIGGFIARWDTYRLDASVQANLKRIEKNLTDLMN